MTRNYEHLPLKPLRTMKVRFIRGWSRPKIKRDIVPRGMTWQDALDKLDEWRRDPDGLAEDELIPPTEAALCKAIEIATARLGCGDQNPYRLVPDGDGGIAFDIHTVTSIEISENGQAENVVLRNDLVYSRVAIN